MPEKLWTKEYQTPAKENNSEFSKISEKLKKQLIPLFTAILISLNPAIKKLNETFPQVIQKISQILIPEAFAGAISWETLAEKEKNSLNIENVWGYIKFDFLGWFADWKYKIENRKIINNLPKQFTENLTIINSFGQLIKIKPKNPFILVVNCEKNKKFLHYRQTLGILFDKRKNYLYVLGYIIKNWNNIKFYPFKEPLEYKINKIVYVIDKTSDKLTIIQWGEQTIKIPLPSLHQYWIKNWLLELKISTNE
jgi:hypothetical protein